MASGTLSGWVCSEYCAISLMVSQSHRNGPNTPPIVDVSCTLLYWLLFPPRNNPRWSKKVVVWGGGLDWWVRVMHGAIDGMYKWVVNVCCERVLQAIWRGMCHSWVDRRRERRHVTWLISTRWRWRQNLTHLHLTDKLGAIVVARTPHNPWTTPSTHVGLIF